MKTKLLSWIALILSVVMMLPVSAGRAESLPAAEQSEEAFSLWNEGAPALSALLDYVEAVTAEGSPDFIPPADRVAVFDMDGTLMGELFPTYLEVVLLAHRILADPSYAPDEEMLSFGRMTRDHALDKSFPADYDYEFSYHQARAFAGMTLSEYADYITRFLVHEADGFDGLTYAGAYYLPMVEVVEYLQNHDFKCYIVSGSDRYMIRTYIEGMVDIPYENIIGSDTALAARDQGDTDGIEYVFTGSDELVRTDRLLVKDLKTNKVLQIAQEIGRQPVLAFGNSSGDVSMLNYTIHHNVYRSAAFMLVADDNVRDYGDPEKGAELAEKWTESGFNVISMAGDWKTIYGEDVIKTGEFRWLEELADDRIPADAGQAEQAQEEIPSDDGQAEQAQEEVQYVMYLGTNDKDTNLPVFTQSEAMEKAREILIQRFGGYTIQEAHGGWIGDDGTEYQEYTLVIYLSDTTEDQVHAAADELIQVFHQSSVLIQANPTRTEFYSGN